MAGFKDLTDDDLQTKSIGSSVAADRIMCDRFINYVLNEMREVRHAPRAFSKQRGNNPRQGMA
jgi:hypothetical protein